MCKKAKYRVRNWPEYNKSLVNRGSLTVWVSEEMIENFMMKSDSPSHGNQVYSDALISWCLMMRQVYGTTLRATQGFIASVLKLMKIALPTPNYSTLSRRAGKLSIDLRPSASKGARHILVDSTGVQVIGGTEWKKIRHKKKGKQLWRKLHLTMDEETLDICSALMTESQRADGGYLAPLLDAIDSPIKQITADGAYDKKACYRAAYDRGAKPVIPPQHNAIVQRNKIKKDPALFERDKLITYLNGGKSYKNRLTRWKKKNNYHRRSLVETTMSRLKYLFGDKVSSKNFDNQVTDLMIRCRIINEMNRLGLPDSVRLT